ncbi:tail completion protein gp17 [Sphingopyxis sp.]|uniref:tail completion protein gp17 n=1 Tax=Sphingopyxis sp. TaxID=1908224 RepID=UPI003D099343
MSSAEQAVRARALALLAGDSELAGLVHGVFDGTPSRASAPYVSVGGADGVDWGTKDRAGREVRLTLALVGVGSSLDDQAAARVEAAVAALRGATDGWSIVSARVMRTRFGFGREGGWRQEVVVRCRCLAE